ncbi:MAG: Ig-like domain-containing protein, partial [Elusimicrobiota bacterium]
AAGSLTSASAVISWATNEAADTQVEYGPTTSYGQSSALNASKVTSHSASLSGLSASTLYHFRVKSRDAAGNLATSGDFSFTTTALPGTYIVPSTIDGTGATDVTAALNNWIATVPNGTAALPSTIMFPSGKTYLLSQGLQFANRSYWTLSGYGAKLKLAPAAGFTQLQSLIIAGKIYNGYYAGGNTNIIIKGFELEQSNPTPGVFNSSREQCSAVEIEGGNGVEVFDILAHGIAGDGFRIGDASQNINIHNNHIQDAGRNGVSIIDGDQVLMENNQFDDMGYYTFDAEPNDTTQSVTNATFRNNTAGSWGPENGYGAGFFAAGGSGYKVIDRITVTGNTINGSANASLLTHCNTNQTTRMSNIVFTNNTASQSAAGPVLNFKNIDGLTITGNTQPLSSGVLTSLNNCTGVITGTDTTAPAVTFTSPAAGSTVSGVIGLSASASDNVGVVGVQFKLDGANQGAEELIAPYEISWVTTGASNGAHTLSAVARDAAGNTQTATVSVTVSNTVADTTAPTAAITAPANGATVSGSITISGTAADNVAVSAVAVSVDGGAFSSASGTSNWIFSLNTASLANGSHSLTARATDSSGNTKTAAISVTVSNAPAVLTPRASYSFNAGSGSTAVDISGNGHTGALVNAAWTSSGKFGGALSFDGSSAYVEIPDADSLTSTDLTLSADVSLAAASAGMATVVNKWAQDGNDEYLFAIDSNRRLTFGWQTTGGYNWATPSFNIITGVGQIPLATMTNVAVVRSGTSISLYINGALDSTFAGAIDANPFHNGTASVRIGAQSRGAEARFLNGIIDEVRIYGRALSQADIQTDMNTAVEPPPSDTTAPAISAVAAGSLTSASAAISWTTNEASDSQVEFGPTTAYGQSSALNASMLTSHSAALSSLNANTLYHYRVKSRDAAGNLGVSGDSTFTTLAVVVPVAVNVSP